MYLQEFSKNDIFRNILKVHPKFNFKIKDNIITINNFPINYYTNYILNLNQNNFYSSSFDINPNNINSFKLDYNNDSLIKWNSYNGINSNLQYNISFPLTTSINITNFTQTYDAENKPSSDKIRLYSLKNVLDKKGVRSPHFLFSSSLGQKYNQSLSLVSIPSIFYGNSIKKGTVSLEASYTGTLISRLQDTKLDGELIETYGPNTGSVAGVALYDEGFVILTGSWDLAKEKITGSNWLALEVNNVNATIETMTSTSTGIFIGGGFTSPANRIARWNGSSYSSLGTGIGNGNVRAIISASDGIYAGGDFTSPVARIARWNGTTWSLLGSGVSSTIFSILSASEGIYVGGEFTSSPNSGRIARWNGSSYSPLGTGLNGTVRAIISASDGIYAGGDFTITGSKIARWNGTTWTGVGNGLNNTVFTLLSASDGIYAGGDFTITGSRIARWNGTTWTAVGSGLSSTVDTIISASDGIYVGGSFTITGSRIARWNGTTWTGVANGLSSTVNSMVSSSNGIYAAGSFNTTGNYISLYQPIKENFKWYEFVTGSNIDYTLNFSGTNMVPNILMMAHAPKEFYNYSNNPTFIEYNQNLIPETGSTYFFENEKINIKNIVKYPYDNFKGDLQKETYISKICIFDENKNLIGIAKISKPIKKTLSRDYTFKLKIDY